MRRRAAFYLCAGPRDSAVDRGAGDRISDRRQYRSQRLDAGAARMSLSCRCWIWRPLFLFVVIGLYGLTVSRLQLQLQHQAEDFGDQMQTLLHRNEELAKVNEEYAEQIAALEAEREEPPGPRDRRQQSASHRRPALAGRCPGAAVGGRPSGAGASARRRCRNFAANAHAGSRAPPAPCRGGGGPAALSQTPLALFRRRRRGAGGSQAGERTRNFADWTANDRSTLIGGILEFDVSAFCPPGIVRTCPIHRPISPRKPAPIRSTTRSWRWRQGISPACRTRPHSAVGAGARGDPVGTEPAAPSLDHASSDLPPARTQGALALDLAESALSSLQSETQEALSSLRAQVEATIPQEAAPAAAPGGEPERTPPKPRPWHLRF